MDLYIYSTPPDADVSLTLDTGQTIHGVKCEANGRADAHRLTLPDNTPSQGSMLRVLKVGCITFEGRGICRGTEFLFDDVHLAPEPAPPPKPAPPDPNTVPLDIINAVYQTGAFDLATHDGCGQFTEECCRQLAAKNSPAWGHIRKNPGQNQYAGHAVDALMLGLGQGCGIYDIIYDSVSPNAHPECNYKGEPDAELWMPPV